MNNDNYVIDRKRNKAWGNPSDALAWYQAELERVEQDVLINDLAALIQQAVKAKKGNREFALFYDGDGAWCAQLGNPSQYVSLGESVGEFCGEGATAEDAVRTLITSLTSA